MIAFPPFRLDLDEGRLWKGETPLTLRRKPFAILCHLAARPQKLVTHDELLAEVWGGAVVSDSAVRSHLHELRQVLGDGVIETVIGRGYRFVAELRDEVVVAPITEGAPVDPLIVGREVELAMLRSAFERALGGRRQLCFVTGEAGIGKSTLVRTFLAGLDPSSVIVGRELLLRAVQRPRALPPDHRGARRARAFCARRANAEGPRPPCADLRRAGTAPRQRRPALGRVAARRFRQ